MRRITTPTAQQDLFGTGLDGFTDGDALSAVPPTHLNADWFNNAQEELARAIEGSGATVVAAGGTPNYWQLDDAIQTASTHGMLASNSPNYVLRGLSFNLTGTSLTVSPSTGEYVYGGRRYVITAAKLAAAGFTSFLLTASRDTYFYIGPNDPGLITSPVDRGTVYITTVAVANGASAPATPAGTFLFAMVVTSGTDATTVSYYNRGPQIKTDGNQGLEFRSPAATSSAVNIIPSNNSVDLGALDGVVPGITRQFFRNIMCERLYLSNFPSAPNASMDQAMSWFEVISNTVAAGATENISQLDLANYPDGTVGLVVTFGTVFDDADPTDAVSFMRISHFHRDGAVVELDGGDAYLFIDGNGGQAAGIAFNISTDNALVLRFTYTGHNTDITQWNLLTLWVINGDT